MRDRRYLGPVGDPVAEAYGFHQALLVQTEDGTSTLSISGQVGDPTADFGGQLSGAMRKIGDLLQLGAMDWADLVRLGFYTTDIEAFLRSWSVVRDCFGSGPVPPNTLVEVRRFAHPAALIEIDGLAVR